MKALKRSLSIMQISSSRSWGGMEMHLGVLSEKLRERGHDVVTLCPEQSRTAENLRKKEFEPINFDIKGYFHPIPIYKLNKLLCKRKIDIIHAHYSRDLWTVVPAAKICCDVPVVLIKHIGTQRPKKDIFHKWIYSNICCVIAISNVIANNVRATHPLPPDIVKVVHHGLDFKLFDNLKSGRTKVRGEFGFRESDIIIGTIGRLQVGKGHLEFLDMAKTISRKWPQTKFMIIGEATLGEDKRAQIIYDKVREVELKDRLILTGFRDDIPDLLAALDIFAFPSHAEAFGLVVIEAMAAGLPIISSNCDGVIDILRHGVTGILVPPKDVKELISAVEELLHNPFKRASLGYRARVESETKFSIDRMVDNVEQIYATCLHHHQLP